MLNKPNEVSVVLKGAHDKVAHAVDSLVSFCGGKSFRLYPIHRLDDGDSVCRVIMHGWMAYVALVWAEATTERDNTLAAVVDACNYIKCSRVRCCGGKWEEVLETELSCDNVEAFSAYADLYAETVYPRNQVSEMFAVLREQRDTLMFDQDELQCLDWTGEEGYLSEMGSVLFALCVLGDTYAQSTMTTELTAAERELAKCIPRFVDDLSQCDPQEVDWDMASLTAASVWAEELLLGTATANGGESAGCQSL